MSENLRGLFAGLRARPAEPAPPAQLITFSVQLPSCHPHVPFDATFQFWWQQGNDQALWSTRQKITESAGRLTARYPVTQAGNAETDINLRDTNGVRVALAAGPQALAAAEAILETDRQAALDRQRQLAELERIRFLRENVYARPDVARSYWLYHHPEQLNAVLSIDFDKIAEKFGDAGESRFLVIAKLIGDFLARLEDSHRQYMLGQLGQLFTSYDRTDLAERLEAP